MTSPFRASLFLILKKGVMKLAKIPRKKSPIDDNALNIDNLLINIVNQLSNSFQNLVIRGQLSSSQVIQVLETLNGLVKKGEISVNDINKNYGKIDQSFLTTELLEQIAGDAPVNSEVADKSVTSKKIAEKAVSLPKINAPFDILPKGLPLKLESEINRVSANIYLKQGDNIVLADNDLEITVNYVLSDGTTQVSYKTGWYTDFEARESRLHQIRVRFKNSSTMEGREDYVSANIYVEHEKMGVRRNELSSMVDEHLHNIQGGNKLNFLNGGINAESGGFSGEDNTRVAVEYLNIQAGESIELLDTNNYNMAIWEEGDNRFKDLWNSTRFDATSETVISFMVRKSDNSTITIEEVKEQILYKNKDTLVRFSDLQDSSVLSSNNMLYPSYPVWGYEYMYSWYDKLRQNKPVIMSWAGDSTTAGGGQGPDGYSRNVLGKKLLTLGGYDETLITSINNGEGSQHTGNWLGGDKDEDKRTPNGFLDRDMKENPDLYIFAYGFNDGSNSHVPNLSWQQRIDRFEENLNEGLERIRGSMYNKSPDEMAIILTTPIAAYDPGRGNFPHNWNDKIRPIIQRACRKYKCAFVDVTARQYDHGFSSSWSVNGDMVHPTGTANIDYMSMYEPLIFPRLLHK